ncbi:MAG: hypothetical protein V3W20_00775 [Candidatus Neomarinimicrobiota bacterium]
MSSKTATKHGITKSVSIVDINKPNSITLASGAHIPDDPPIPNAMGNKPAMVVRDVRIIGLRRI